MRKPLPPFVLGILAFAGFLVFGLLVSQMLAAVLGIVVSLLAGYWHRHGILPFLAGVAAAVAAWIGLGWLVASQPVQLAAVLVPAVGTAALVFAAVFFFVGRFIAARQRSR